MPELLIIGSNQSYTLESSYYRAFQQLGWDVQFWNPIEALHRTVPGGKLGRLISGYILTEPWQYRISRQLVLKVQELQPDLILTFTHSHIQPGALAQIKMISKAKLINVWPDTMANWSYRHSANLCLYDLIATYSSSSVPIIQKMGGQHVIWVPLAGDPILHSTVNRQLEADEAYCAEVSFIGGWRPEREAILTQLGNYNLKIWGPEWGRRCKNNPIILKAWQKRPLFGDEFVRAVLNSKVNLNIIDPTNYPAANMRFFELAVIGGVQVCSLCPEMDETFRDNEHVFYYSDSTDLDTLIPSLLIDFERRQQVAKAGQVLALAAHTYKQRAETILEYGRSDLLASEIDDLI